MNQKSSLLRNISIFLTFLLCVMLMQGWRSFGTNTLILFGVWLIVTILAYYGEIMPVLRQRRFAVLYVFLIFYFLSSFFSVGAVSALNRVVAFMSVCSPILMYELLKRTKRSTRIRFVVILTIVLLFDVFLSFQYQRLLGVTTMRDASILGDQYYIVYIAFNISYSLALIAPACLEIIKKQNKRNSGNKKNVIVLGFLMVLFSIFLVRAQFMTAIILALLGFVFVMFYKNKRLFRFLIGVGFAFVVFVLVLPSIIDFLDNNRKYNDISYRLGEIQSVISGNEQDAVDIGSRQNLSMLSLETFLRNPIFGVNHRLTDDQHVIQQGVGNHASWPDSLALYGLFALLLFYFLFDSLKRQKNDMGSTLTMVLFIVLGFFNPLLFFPQMFSVFLYIPLLYQLFLESPEEVGTR